MIQPFHHILPRYNIRNKWEISEDAFLWFFWTKFLTKFSSRGMNMMFDYVLSQTNDFLLSSLSSTTRATIIELSSP